MKTFILIMTLWGNDHAFIHSVNFRSENLCQYAAKQWLYAFDKNTVKRTAICVAYH